jgi:hypothetical protein
VCLDKDGSVPNIICHSFDLVEQNCFAHAAKAREQHALFWTPLSYSSEQNPGLL